MPPILVSSSPGVLLGPGEAFGLGVLVARTVAGGKPIVGVAVGTGVFEGFGEIRVGVADGGAGVSVISGVGGGVGVRVGFTVCCVGVSETVGEGATDEAGATGVTRPEPAGGTVGAAVTVAVVVGGMAVAVCVGVAVRRGVGLGVGDEERVRMLSASPASVGSAVRRGPLVGPTTGVNTASTVTGG